MNDIIIIGKVTDTLNVPLFGTNISDATNKTGTSSDANGNYQLSVSKTQTTLTISHIGYKTIKKNITEEIINNAVNDTLYFNIVMEPEFQELEPVEISSEKVTLAYDEPNTFILDYEFHNDDILLLISNFRSYQLRLVNQYDSTLFNKTVDLKAKSLYKDCMGSMHLFGKDSVYQIHIDSNNTIQLYEGISMLQFDSVMPSCVAFLNDNFFFQHYAMNDNSIYYYMVNKEEKQEKPIQLIVDSASVKDREHFYSSIDRYSAHNIMGNISVSQLHQYRGLMQNIAFYEIIVAQPIYTPLKKIQDSIFIFNHITDSAYIFDNNGELQRTFGIDYHLQKDWKDEIIVDEDNQYAYAKFMKGGIVYLKRINLNNGKLISQTKLEQNTFPEEIKIKNGFVYYLHKDIKAYYTAKNLYKQRLE